MANATEHTTAAPSPAHPLDRVIWHALTSRHAGFAEGGTPGQSLALRYPERIARFADVADRSAEAFHALETLLPADGQLALFTVDAFTPPPAFKIALRDTLEQMLATRPSAPVRADLPAFVPLGAADVPEMLSLVEKTKPGPFSTHTYELGGFIGIRVDGRLVAMTGQRMNCDGFTEVSAVCVDPDHRGRGYADALVSAVSKSIFERGDMPFLHVFTKNVSALALYQKLGFTIRRTMTLTVLERA
jgi:ribosomal protein S18 acetylase RimI-like enzyme